MNIEVAIVDERLPIRDVVKQVEYIQEIMKSLMKDGEHYGKIPGTNKPSLWKSGAEKLCVSFRLKPKYTVNKTFVNGVFTYEVNCRLIRYLPDGSTMDEGEGEGNASTGEDKYAWRRAVSDAEYDNAEDLSKRIKYRKTYEEKQVRNNPFDILNTVKKMACKRAYVAATLSATAASDIFTQDTEDLPPEYLRPQEEIVHETVKPYIYENGITEEDNMKAFLKHISRGLTDKQKNIIWGCITSLEFGYEDLITYFEDITILEGAVARQYIGKLLDDRKRMG